MRFSTVVPIGVCVLSSVGCAGSSPGSQDDLVGAAEGGSAGYGASAVSTSSTSPVSTSGSGVSGSDGLGYTGNLVGGGPASGSGSAQEGGAGKASADEADAGAGQEGSGPPDGGLSLDGGVIPGAPSTDQGVTEALSAIPLTTPDGLYYLAQLAVGNQTFAVDIDTGSSTAALAGTSCTSCKRARVATLYAPTTTATDQRSTARSTYGDGSGWNGEIYRDTVGLAHGTPTVQLDLVSITTQNMFFGRGTWDGILGLGPNALALRGTNAYPTQVFTAGVTPVLAFELCASTGTMWIGGFDASAASSAVQYTPLVTSGGFYSIGMSDLSVGGKSLGLRATDFGNPIVDTGTSLFYFPTKVFQAILTAINASQGFKSVFGTARLSATGNGCVQGANATVASVDAALPALTATLPASPGGSAFTLNLRPTQSYLRDGGGGQFCLAMGDAGNQIGTLLGDAFLSAFITVIDLQNARVGFAPEAACRSAHSHRTIDPTAWPPPPPRRLGLR